MKGEIEFSADSVVEPDRRFLLFWWWWWRWWWRGHSCLFGLLRLFSCLCRFCCRLFGLFLRLGDSLLGFFQFGLRRLPCFGCVLSCCLLCFRFCCSCSFRRR